MKWWWQPLLLNQDKLDSESLFFALSKYTADKNIKNKVNLLDEVELEEVESVDDILRDYIAKKRYSIKLATIKKHQIIWIFKGKKLLHWLPVENYVAG